ncbi:FAD-binding protein [Actinomadura chibensis]|uniref:FAD-binding protein n=2 Tax=Actinomadura chibensis TaxID=392828 RepID=A0A5D0NYV4_9ACTN|nr:FAD-binding protein [Actinomadura chibensis]
MRGHGRRTAGRAGVPDPRRPRHDGGDGTMTLSHDVLVVGGGPAGLSAAARLAAAGLTVAIADEQPELGGQYFRRPSPAVLRAHGDHRPEGGRLIARVRELGVDCLTGHLVWGVADDGRTLFATAPDGGAVRLRARHVIVATGAYERTHPFPGWQLPGVTTPGFAQHLAAADGTPVGRRVLVAGSGPFLLPVACSLLDAGAEVVAVAEAGHPYTPSLRATAALRHPARLRELAGYMARLARARVPIWQGRVVTGASGDGRVSSVTVAATADPARPLGSFAVDAVCVGYGFRPQPELARLLGCEIRADAATGDAAPVTDAFGRTSRPGVYVVGEAAGIGGVHLARARGLLAAAHILGARGAGDRREVVRLAARARALGRFTALSEALYPSPAALQDALAGALPDETVVCRCEAVTAADVRAAAADRAGGDLNATKSWSRAGMGPCQGRFCGFAVAGLVRAAREGERGEPVFPARQPVRPVPVETLLALGEQEPEGDAA